MLVGAGVAVGVGVGVATLSHPLTEDDRALHVGTLLHAQTSYQYVVPATIPLPLSSYEVTVIALACK